jgi:hypothetical protein
VLGLAEVRAPLAPRLDPASRGPILAPSNYSNGHWNIHLSGNLKGSPVFVFAFSVILLSP